MKCREAQYWLYSFRPNASWPVDVVGHLQQCSKCQQLQTQLKQIDQGIDKLTSAPGDPAALARLLDRVGKTPQTAAPKQITPKPVPRWGRLALYFAGAAALIALGFFLGRFGDTVQVVPGEPIEKIKIVTEVRDRIQKEIVEVHSPADRTLFSTLLKRNARLVQASQAMDRLDTLLDMADDCRQHALKLIDHGPRDALPLTVDLYNQLLQEGVVVQLAQAPPEARPPLQKAARARLEKMADAPAEAPKNPALAAQRNALQSATQQAIKQVDRPEEALPKDKTKKPARAEAMTPAATLVQFAVAVSSESDPGVKAALCTNYVERLMPTMNLYLSEDNVPQRGEMGQQFGELIQFGVIRPAEQLASVKEPEAPVKAETDRLFQFAADAIASMEKSLEKAPEEARQGFERAIEASKKGWEKSKGKGKGPPAGKGKDKHERGPREIRGTLQKIDPAQGTITLSAKINGKDSQFTYALSRELLTAVVGRPTPLAELKIGAGVQLRLSEDRKTVTDIRSSQDDGQKNQK